jgi:hypothetical protein
MEEIKKLILDEINKLNEIKQLNKNNKRIYKIKYSNEYYVKYDDAFIKRH